jgi:SAM-dependent methyltransferase
VTLAPGFVEALTNLAGVLLELGQNAEAAAAAREALALAPDLAEAQTNLGLACLELGDRDGALAVLPRAAAASESPAARDGFVRAVSESPPGRSLSPDLAPVLARALAEPWCRPSRLAGAAATVLTAAMPLSPDNPLLLTLLETTPVTDPALEAYVAAAGQALVEAAAAGAVLADPESGRFPCALARQAFIGEYVIDCQGERGPAVDRLAAAVMAALAEGAPVSLLALAAVAVCRPLHTLAGAERLADGVRAGVWPAPAAALIRQQVIEPSEERRLAAALPSLTAIDDAVSRRVQQQYEENPYPRWVGAAPARPAVALDAYFARAFPGARYQPRGQTNGLDILVAGGGTGQHPIELARTFQDARVLAIDLSRASLAYAARQAGRLGVEGLTFAQADILQLGGLAQRFDVIDASGVLHHLAEPLAGWRVLLSLLRPGGVMRIGLYSQLARRPVTAARALIAERGDEATVDGIRRCRRALLALPADHPAKSVTSWPDFSSTSECRDLLFHVQEHQLTLPVIADWLRLLGLTLVGLDVPAPVRAAYRRRYPEDRPATDLGRWHAFETDHPNTFRGMYQFWLQRAKGGG